MCVLWPFVQVAECSHPYEENPLNSAEKLCRETEYYLHVLLKRELLKDGSEVLTEGESEQGNSVRIDLNELFVFPQIKKLCSSVQDVRYAFS